MMNFELEQAKKDNTRKDNSIVKDLLNINISQKQEEVTPVNIKDNISKGHQIIEDIQSNKVDKFQGMKDFLLNLDVITKNVDKTKYQDSIIEELKKIIEDSKHNVMDLIDKAPSTQVISSSLDTILIKIECALDNKKSRTYNTLHFEKIDKLYLKMYNAMQQNDKKKVAFYRGRLIRELKKEKKVISQMYDNVKVLDEINSILKNENASLLQISDVLNREENKDYKNLLSSYLNNENSFRNAFQNLYDEKEVRRIVLYNNALKEELKNQRVYYKKRYDEEFLGKKGDVLTTLKSFPTAIALSVKSIANSVNELQEAKTNKMKVQKTLNILKDMGKLAATPIIATGKFIMSNWYTLLKLYKGQNLLNDSNSASKKDSNNNLPSPNDKEFIGPHQKSIEPEKEKFIGPPRKDEVISKTGEISYVPEDSEIDKLLNKDSRLKNNNNPYADQIIEPKNDNSRVLEYDKEGDPIIDENVNIDPETTNNLKNQNLNNQGGDKFYYSMTPIGPLILFDNQLNVIDAKNHIKVAPNELSIMDEDISNKAL